MKFTIKHGCYITRYYEIEAKTNRKAENYFWKHFGNLDELKEFKEECNLKSEDLLHDDVVQCIEYAMKSL